MAVNNDEKMRQDIVIFLRKMADKLEKDDLSAEATSEISEFFMRFLFMESLNGKEYSNEKDSNEKDSREDSNQKDSNEKENEENQDDMLKFLSLGWYIYTHLKEETPE